MAFSTACLKNVPDLRRGCFSLLIGAARRLGGWLLALILLPAMVWAAEIEVANPQLQATEEGYALSEAVQVLARLRNWVVIERGDKGVRPGESYDAALRLRLDVTQLPRPFQISALGNKDWSLASDWKIWQATLSALPSPEAK